MKKKPESILWMETLDPDAMSPTLWVSVMAERSVGRIFCKEWGKLQSDHLNSMLGVTLMNEMEVRKMFYKSILGIIEG